MFLVPLKAKGVTIQPVYTFQDERTDITFYDGVHVPDSYRLGGVNEGSKTMSAGLEQEHGGGFSKVQRAMLKAAVQVCSEIRRNGRPSIEHTQAQVRLARSAADLLVSDLLTFRSIWASVTRSRTPASARKNSWRRARPARPDRSQFALESGRAGRVPQPVLSPCAGHDNLRRHERGPSQHDRRACAGDAQNARLIVGSVERMSCVPMMMPSTLSSTLPDEGHHLQAEIAERSVIVGTASQGPAIESLALVNHTGNIPDQLTEAVLCSHNRALDLHDDLGG